MGLPALWRRTGRESEGSHDSASSLQFVLCVYVRVVKGGGGYLSTVHKVDSLTTLVSSVYNLRSCLIILKDALNKMINDFIRCDSWTCTVYTSMLGNQSGAEGPKCNLTCIQTQNTRQGSVYIVLVNMKQTYKIKLVFSVLYFVVTVLREEVSYPLSIDVLFSYFLT